MATQISTVPNTPVMATPIAVAIPPPEVKPDIEHVQVTDDPRQWSNLRKSFTLFLVASAAMIGGLSATIQNPAIQDMEQELHASSSQISLSIAVFILIQGLAPLFWTSIAEIKGRKIVYIISIAIFLAGSVAVALAPTVEMVIGFRCLQAAGSSAVLAIGAATLADIYEPSERGSKMGVYYISITLSSSIGPIFGGVLTQLFHWRGPFWFLTIFSAFSLLSFMFVFKDTYRPERSAIYQNTVQHHLKERERKRAMMLSNDSSSTIVGEGDRRDSDLEKARPEEEIKLTLRDINVIRPLWQIIRRWNNIVSYLSSALLYSFNFAVVYTGSRTLGTAYHFNPLQIGFVLVSYGAGSMCGSLLGGKYSDYILRKQMEANGGVRKPELRLYSTLPGMILLPPCVIGFAWVSDKTVHVAALSILLFLCGFFLVSVYASCLAYIVDSNPGRSSTAVSVNAAVRGTSAFIATEIAAPIQDAVGDGIMYTSWTGIIILSQLCTLLVLWKGGQWREQAERSESSSQPKPEPSSSSSDLPSSKPSIPSGESVVKIKIPEPTKKLQVNNNLLTVPTVGVPNRRSMDNRVFIQVQVPGLESGVIETHRRAPPSPLR